MAVDARQLKPAMMILLCVSTSTWADPAMTVYRRRRRLALNGEAVFQLSIVLNHYDTGMVVPVTQREGAFFISSADLLRAGLPPEHVPAGDVNLSTLPQVRVEYDSAAQRLLLGRSGRLGRLTRDPFQRTNVTKQTALRAGSTA